jgi:ABC-type branched-subunit amino acid transport system substrate-binding protein
MEKSAGLEIFLPDLALDFLYREDLSLQLREVVGETGYVRLWTRKGPIAGEDFEQAYLEAFSAYTSRLTLKNTHIIATTDYISQAKALQSQYPHLYPSSFTLPTAISLDFALNFIGKTIKPAAINHLALFTDPKTADNLLKALDLKRLNKPGYVYIVSQTASLYRYSGEMTGLRANGVLFVGENALIEKTMSDFLLETVRNQVNRIFQAYENDVFHSKITLLPPKFHLFSLQNGIPETSNTLSTLHFPGNITNLPSQYRAQIAISANYDLTDAYFPDLNIGHLIMRGLKIAFDEVNSRHDLLPNYYMVNNSVNYLGIGTDYNTTRMRLAENRHLMGLLYVATPSPQGIKWLFQLLKQENRSIPILGSTVTSELSEPQAYPMYLRPRVSSSFLAAVTLRLLRGLEWREVAVIYTKDAGDSQDFYEHLRAYSQLYSVDIVNKEELRGLPELLTHQAKSDINATLADIKAADTRVIVLFVPYYPQILTQMYDLQMTNYLLIYINSLSLSSFSGLNLHKFASVSQGALVLSPSLFVGTIGAELKQKVREIDRERYVPNTCLYYDLAYLYFYAVDYLLQRGMDYEDPAVLVKAMRETHFVGCSGFFKILKGSNDRDESRIDIYNLQLDARNNSHKLAKVGIVNPYGASPIAFSDTIQWPDLQPAFPYRKPKYLDCPYTQASIVPVPTSKAIALMIYSTVAGLAICTVGLIWRQWQTFSPEAISQKQPLSTDDVIVYFSIVLDYFQYISLGPDVSGLIGVLWSTSSSLSLTFREFIQLTNGMYWVAINSVLVITAVWTIASLFIFGGVLIFAKCKKCLKDCSLIQWMGVVSNVLFLSIVSILTNVYQCSYGVSTALTDSFMDKDCLTFCWRGSHLHYAIGTTTALLIYIPVSLLTRPIWQELQPNLHIKAYPTTQLIKALVQMVLLGLAGVLKTEYPRIHGIVYICVVSGLIVYMMTNRQFNYSRVNMWQILQMLGSISVSIFALIQPNTRRIVLISTLFSLYFVFIAVGIALQCCVKKYRSQLTRQKSKDIRGLLEFAFTKGKRAEIALQSYYQTNNLSTTEQNFLPIHTSHQLLS